MMFAQTIVELPKYGASSRDAPISVASVPVPARKTTIPSRRDERTTRFYRVRGSSVRVGAMMVSCPYSTKLVPGLWRFTVRRNGIPWVERADESAREQDLLDEFGRCAANLREGAAQHFNREQLLLTNYNKTKHGAPIIRTPALVEPLRLKKPLEDAPLCVQIPP